jgi:prepilin-type N-terminal cleavage/methylation domain-containing protein
MTCKPKQRGFTLIEMSIVLVIIGLIVGGILVGQDLIRAAAVRAQVSQIEQFNTAANTFRSKYGGLPGDLNSAAASQFGFLARGSLEGQGDGNGTIEGIKGDGSNIPGGWFEGEGETAVFWRDLSTANLISGNYQGLDTFTTGYAITATTSVTINQWFPAAKIVANSVYVWSGGFGSGDGLNYFGISNVSSIPFNSIPLSTPGLTVRDAFNIDTKMDDGLPQTGNVKALYLNNTINWNTATWAAGGGVSGTSDTSATPGSSTTCYDNNSNGGTPQKYSLSQNNGIGTNCALSFKLQ